MHILSSDWLYVYFNIFKAEPGATSSDLSIFKS
jgi:hypothetical protein